MRNINPESTSDLISNLPCNVIECILSRLPIREAARTSILSTKWRYQWVTLSHLVFHDLGNDSYFYQRQPTLELVKIINGVLMHHNGPILKFVLSISGYVFCPRMVLRNFFLMFLVGIVISCLLISFHVGILGTLVYKIVV